MNNPVIGLFVAAFEFGDVAVADEDGFGEFGLGEFQRLAGEPDSIIGGHETSITESGSLSKARQMPNEY